MFRLCTLLCLFALPVFADVTGVVRTIDGDTLDIGGTRVRLHGIDAPEMDQTCDYARGGQWACGEWVAGEVARRYDGRIAQCEERDVDRYGRVVGRCVVDGVDIAEDIVLDGFAWAYRRYSMEYDLAEKSAAVREAGLWSGGMQNPAAYRADQRPPPQTAPDANCIIKGNISASGRIYHLPRNAHYDDTRINEADGERWFCSEVEAQAAGWRAARN